MQRAYEDEADTQHRSGFTVIAAIKVQLLGISSGGLPILAKKLGLIALVPPSLLVILVVRLLRPLILIRFGPLVSFRIGHFSSNTETYLTERDAGLHGKRVLDIFYHRFPICNQQLRKMWKGSSLFHAWLVCPTASIESSRVARLIRFPSASIRGETYMG